MRSYLVFDHHGGESRLRIPPHCTLDVHSIAVSAEHVITKQRRSQKLAHDVRILEGKANSQEMDLVLPCISISQDGNGNRRTDVSSSIDHLSIANVACVW